MVAAAALGYYKPRQLAGSWEKRIREDLFLNCTEDRLLNEYTRDRIVLLSGGVEKSVFNLWCARQLPYMREAGGPSSADRLTAQYIEMVKKGVLKPPKEGLWENGVCVVPGNG